MAFVHMRLQDNLGRIRMWVNIWGGRPPLFSFKLEESLQAMSDIAKFFDQYRKDNV